MHHPVLIDTDAGVDDALALIFALRSPEIRVHAITTVAGNVHVSQCTQNVHAICDFVRPIQAPRIVQGASRPLKRRLVTAPEVHGADGLGNARPSMKRVKQKDEAVAEILAFVAEYGRRGTIIAIGPLTNIARAIQEAPDTMCGVGNIVSMGGAFRVAGNTGPVAEFNYYVDPDAASIVLSAGIPTTIVPLDATQQFILSREELVHACSNYGDSKNRFILELTEHYTRYHLKTEKFNGAYLHDPLAVALVVAPRLVKTERVAGIAVETGGEWIRGMTTQIEVHRRVRRTRLHIARSFRFEKFGELFLRRLFG
jgi:purine nucleosidase/pyrimidine-specific ribonucleoside hydrolase